jgi:glycosyltransferase involved in cell wall biosynthesis
MTPSRTRVCFVTNRLVVGGAERHTLTVANALDPVCFAPTFVTLNCGGALEPLINRELLGDPVSLDISQKLDRAAIRRLSEHFDRTACEVVFAANPYATLHACLAGMGARHRPRLLSTFHSNSLLTLKERAQFPLYRLVFLACDALVYVSENQRKHWRSRLVRARNDLAILNGVDTDHFSASGVPCDRETTRRSLGVASGDFLIGACAALRPEKGLSDLVEAVARLRQRDIPARALLIGDGPDRDHIETSARRLRVHDSVHITGFQMDVRSLILACDAMTLTSRSETFSLAALESMALGRPIVMTDVGGASEQVIHGKCGFLYRPGDIDRLVDALSILSNREIASMMGQEARQRVCANFRLEQMISCYSSLIVSLARGRPPD